LTQSIILVRLHSIKIQPTRIAQGKLKPVIRRGINFKDGKIASQKAGEIEKKKS
jgi:hypothetical protein